MKGKICKAGLLKEGIYSGALIGDEIGNPHIVFGNISYQIPPTREIFNEFLRNVGNKERYTILDNPDLIVGPDKILYFSSMQKPPVENIKKAFDDLSLPLLIFSSPILIRGKYQPNLIDSINPVTQ